MIYLRKITNQSMQKSIKYILGISIVIYFVFSCKKGDNDPFISLRSREARITANWHLTESSLESHDLITVSNQFQHIAESDGIDQTIIENFIIKKDGTYKIENIYNKDSYIEEGSWFFGRKNKELDIKNKESIVLLRTKYYYHYNGINYMVNYPSYITTGSTMYSRTILIDELKHNKLVLQYEGETTTEYLTGKPQTTIYTGTKTYTTD